MTDADRAYLEEACAKMAMVNDPHLPLFRDAADGRIALGWAYHPSADWAFRRIRAVDHMPAVFIIGDDPDPDSRGLGPAGWRMAAKLRHWVRDGAAIVHGSAGHPEHYREASIAAQYVRRCVLIECESRHALAWAAFMACPRTLLIVPPAGTESHPTQQHRGVMH